MQIQPCQAYILTVAATTAGGSQKVRLTSGGAMGTLSIRGSGGGSPIVGRLFYHARMD